MVEVEVGMVIVVSCSNLCFGGGIGGREGLMGGGCFCRDLVYVCCLLGRLVGLKERRGWGYLVEVLWCGVGLWWWWWCTSEVLGVFGGGGKDHGVSFVRSFVNFLDDYVCNFQVVF